MNRQLARSIVECFREDVTGAERLPTFKERDWKSIKRWLDASGLGIYFLHRVKALRLENCIPEAFLETLEQNARDHRLQTEEMFAEFADLVSLFQANELRFAVQKGFSLVPDYCPDPSMRLQLDLDFLVSADHCASCEELLMTRGYRVIHRHVDELCMQRGKNGIPLPSELYKRKGQWRVELHAFPFDHASDEVAQATALSSTELSRFRGVVYPVLPAPKVFLAQSCHLFRHARNGWLRDSWLLELHHFVEHQRHNALLWHAVEQDCAGNPQAGLAVAFAARMTSEIFGEFRSPLAGALLDELLPAGVKRWISRYAWDVALAKFPGNKLHVLLEGELSPDREAWRSWRRQIMLPLHRPPRINPPPASMVERRKLLWGQARHIAARIGLHLREFPRMIYETWAWNHSSAK